MMKVILVAGTMVIIAAFALGGRYSVMGQAQQVFVLDRFTGAVRVCNSEECKLLPTNDPWAVISQQPKKPN